MGLGSFLKKTFKGIKGAFKRIGRGIKSGFQKFGKFMNKIGIVGQIAMAFILPGIGNAMLNTFTSTIGKWATFATKAGGVLGNVAKGASWVLGKAGQFAGTTLKAFKTVTGAVTDFIGTTTKYIGGKLGLSPKLTLKEAWTDYSGKMVDRWGDFSKTAGEFLDPKYDFTSWDPNKIQSAEGSILEDMEGKTASEIDDGRLGPPRSEIRGSVANIADDDKLLPDYMGESNYANLEVSPAKRALSSQDIFQEEISGSPSIGYDPDYNLSPVAPKTSKSLLSNIYGDTKESIVQGIRDIPKKAGEAFSNLPGKAADKGVSMGLQRLTAPDLPELMGQAHYVAPYQSPTIQPAPTLQMQHSQHTWEDVRDETAPTGAWGNKYFRDLMNSYQAATLPTR